MVRQLNNVVTAALINRIITELCSSPQLIADWHTLNKKLVNTQEGMTNKSFFKTA